MRIGSAVQIAADGLFGTGLTWSGRKHQFQTVKLPGKICQQFVFYNLAQNQILYTVTLRSCLIQSSKARYCKSWGMHSGRILFLWLVNAAHWDLKPFW